MVSTKLVTAEELERLPDDGFDYELVRGELVRMPPPGFEHLEIIGLLITYLNNFILPRSLGVVGGEGGFVLERDPDTVRAPDVVFIRADRVPSGEARRHYVEQGPDLAIEVRSPSDSLRNLRAKADEYLAAGTRLVWIFDPRTRTAVVDAPDGGERTLGAGDTLDGGDVLSRFALPLAAIFRDRSPVAPSRARLPLLPRTVPGASAPSGRDRSCTIAGRGRCHDGFDQAHDH